LPGKSKTVREYLKELAETKKEKPPQVKEALEIYAGLWESVIEKGIVHEEDVIDDALTKIDAKGGLYQAASE
jgi:hypothetical protein